MLIKMIEKELGDKLDGYRLAEPVYEMHGMQVAYFIKNNINMYVITDGEKIVDIQID